MNANPRQMSLDQYGELAEQHKSLANMSQRGRLVEPVLVHDDNLNESYKSLDVPHSTAGKGAHGSAAGLAATTRGWAGSGGELKTVEDRKAADQTNGLDEDLNNRTHNSDMNFMLT